MNFTLIKVPLRNTAIPYRAVKTSSNWPQSSVLTSTQLSKERAKWRWILLKTANFKLLHGLCNIGRGKLDSTGLSASLKSWFFVPFSGNLNLLFIKDFHWEPGNPNGRWSLFSDESEPPTSGICREVDWSPLDSTGPQHLADKQKEGSRSSKHP